MKDPEYLTKGECMELLRISKGTLDKIMRRREIPFIKLERKVLFKKKDIDAFLESRKVG
jgi:excisionase family DNA binding protein